MFILIHLFMYSLISSYLLGNCGMIMMELKYSRVETGLQDLLEKRGFDQNFNNVIIS